MRCGSCGGTSSIPRHGVEVCAICLFGKSEVWLMEKTAERGEGGVMNLEQLIKLVIEFYGWNEDAFSLRKLEQSLKDLSEEAGREAKTIEATFPPAS